MEAEIFEGIFASPGADALMPPADLFFRSLKPPDSAKKRSVGGGLRLCDTGSGLKSRRHNFRLDGYFYALALGQCPQISLKAAREKMPEANKSRDAGVSPRDLKEAAKSSKSAQNENAFGAAAREWFEGTKVSLAGYWGAFKRICCFCWLRRLLLKLLRLSFGVFAKTPLIFKMPLSGATICMRLGRRQLYIAAYLAKNADWGFCEGASFWIFCGKLNPEALPAQLTGVPSKVTRIRLIQLH